MKIFKDRKSSPLFNINDYIKKKKIKPLLSFSSLENFLPSNKWKQEGKAFLLSLRYEFNSFATRKSLSAIPCLSIFREFRGSSRANNRVNQVSVIWPKWGRRYRPIKGGREGKGKENRSRISNKRKYKGGKKLWLDRHRLELI